MSTKEQSVTLLRKNKLAQVEAFRSIGMTDVDENMRASDFARRIVWAAGLLDICLAADRVKVIDGVDTIETLYFTKAEWSSLSATQQLKFNKKGLRVRAYGHSFTLAPSDASDDAGSYTMAWSNHVNVDNMENRTFGAAYNDFAGAANTLAVINELSGTTGSQNVKGCPAAQAAASYKAYSIDSQDGYDDVSDWHLPGLGCLFICLKLKAEINDAFTFFWSADACMLKTVNYWSSTETDASSTWSVNPGSCFMQNSQKSSKLRVRPVCDES